MADHRPGPPLHIAVNGWFAGDQASGSGQYTHHLLAWLPRVAPGSRFTLLLPEARRAVLADLAQRWPGVEPCWLALPALPRNLAKLWWEQRSVPAAAARLSADVLWVPYWAAPYWQPAPVAVTIHDLIPLLLPEYGGGRLQRLYTRLVSHTARRSAAVIAVSHAGARDVVVHLGIPAARVYAVPHGPNQEGMPAPSEAQLAAVRERYALPARFFLYLGSFDVRKNVAGVLAAYRRYLNQGGAPEVKLVIAGKLPAVDTPFFPDPQKNAAELGLAGQVHFCGWIDEADKPALYTLATAFIFPSRYEGFGMMVLEAMQAGCPVVTGDRRQGE